MVPLRDMGDKSPFFRDPLSSLWRSRSTCGVTDGALPIVPHLDWGDPACCGCLFIRMRGDQAEIVCNECGVVVRTVPAERAREVMLEMMSVVISRVENHCSGAWPGCLLGSSILAPIFMRFRGPAGPTGQRRLPLLRRAERLPWIGGHRGFHLRRMRRECGGEEGRAVGSGQPQSIPLVAPNSSQ